MDKIEVNDYNGNNKMKDLVHDDLEDIDENLIKDIDILMIGDEIDY